MTPDRRELFAALTALGIGPAAFRRAAAAQAARDGPTKVTPEMVKDAEWVAGVTLSDDDRKKVATSLTNALTSTLVGGILTAPSGASFWDNGTLSSRLYGGVGIRLLSLLDLSRISLHGSQISFEVDHQINILADQATQHLVYVCNHHVEVQHLGLEHLLAAES